MKTKIKETQKRPKNKGTVVSIFDKKNLPHTRLHKKKKCSRCKKYILGTPIEIRPTWDRETRRLNYYYAYHEKCLDKKYLKLKLNLLGHWFLWKLERILKRKLYQRLIKRK